MAGKRGRPSREPTEAEREKVKQLVEVGTPIADIAKLLSWSVPTLRKYFSRELFSGKKIKPASTFKPSVLHREKVIRYVGCKMRTEDVARAIGCTEEDLLEHFAEELATGHAQARAQVIDSLFDQMADDVTSATNRLEALTAFSSDPESGSSSAPGYVGKKVAARAIADAAVAEGGKFAPRNAPRLVVSGGKTVADGD